MWAGKQKLSGKNAGKYEGAWQAFDRSLMDLMISKGYDIELSFNQQLQTGGDPATNIEVLFAASDHTLDVFRETVVYPFSGGKIVNQNTVYVQYAKPKDGGRITGFSGYQKTTYLGPNQQVVKYGELFISNEMKQFMFIVEQSVYHCFDCASNQSALGKWWDFIWSTNEESKNKLKNGAQAGARVPLPF